jgi:hypothetical protein
MAEGQLAQGQLEEGKSAELRGSRQRHDYYSKWFNLNAV